MAKYSNTKAKINEKITTNTSQAITGNILNEVLQTMVDSLGADYQFGGLVQPGSTFTAGEQPVVFFATTPGTYHNFGSLVVADGEVALLVWSGTAWSKQSPDIATRTEVSQLGQKIISGGNIPVPLLGTIQATIDASADNELVVKPTASANSNVAFFEVKKGHRYVITIPLTVPWEFSQSYCDDILTSAPTENTNLGGEVNSNSYIISEEEKTINLTSDRDGYYCITFNNTGGTPIVVDIIEGLEGFYPIKGTQEDILEDIVVDNRIERETPYRDGIILQAIIVLSNSNFRTYYTPCKQGERFLLNCLGVASNAYIGFTPHIPEVKMSVSGGDSKQAQAFYGDILIAPIDGYFCVSLPKTDSAPAVYKINQGVGGYAYNNTYKAQIQKNLLSGVNLDELECIIIPNSATPVTAEVGEKYVPSSNAGRHLIKADIEGLSGTLFGVVYGVSGSNNCVCVTNRDDVILGFIDINYKSWYTEIVVGIDKYPNAKYVYFTSGNTYQSIKHYNNPINNARSFADRGTIILHFDGDESAINGTLIQRRKQIVQSYGWKASFCVSVSVLNDAGTDWRSTDIKNEFWGLIKDGWDVMLYPAMSAVTKNENEWNAWFDDVLAKFANVGVYNITTLACGNLAINDDLLNAAIKHNFKIIRGGGMGADNTYVYSTTDEYVPQIETHNKNIVLRAYMIGGDAQTIAPVYLDNIQNAVESNGAVAIFSHTAYKTLPSGDYVNISEDYLIMILDYIKSLEQQGKIQVMSMGDFYAYANPQDCHIWDNNRVMKMLTPR